MSDPIIVTGIGRSGTTFTQHLLCRHPHIWISGQPVIALSTLNGWLDQLVSSAASGAEQNERLNYYVPHFVSQDPIEIAADFADLLYHRWAPQWYYRRRWGIKSPWAFLPAECKLIDRLWPNAEWIVCFRDPQRVYESLCGTGHSFTREQVQAMHETAKAFAEERGALTLFVDEWDAESRPVHVANLLRSLGEEMTPEVAAFVERWPRIHARETLPC